MTRFTTLCSKLHQGPLYQYPPITGEDHWMPAYEPKRRVIDQTVQAVGGAIKLTISDIYDPWFGTVKKCEFENGSTPSVTNELDNLHKAFLRNLPEKMASVVLALSEGPLHKGRDTNGKTVWYNPDETQEYNHLSAVSLVTRGIAITGMQNGVLTVVLAGSEPPEETDYNDDLKYETEDESPYEDESYYKDVEEDCFDDEEDGLFDNEEDDFFDEEPEEEEISEADDPSEEGPLDQDSFTLDDTAAYDAKEIIRVIKEDAHKTTQKGLENVCKTILVDSETVPEKWVNLIDDLEERDAIVVFYAGAKAALPYRSISRLMNNKNADKVYWQGCYEGRNALEFQLSTGLGSIIERDLRNKQREQELHYYILSQNVGFDLVENYWDQKGVYVRRINSDSEIWDLEGK